MRTIYMLFFPLMALLFSNMLAANNIQVSNFSLTGTNTTKDYVMVQFDLSWENSWRTASSPNNWDAAWVFCKIPRGNRRLATLLSEQYRPQRGNI